MVRRLSETAASVFCLLCLAQVLSAQVGSRILRRPDNGAVVRIPGTTHPVVAAATQIGRAPSNMPMERMLLNLRSSPEQQAALEQLLAEQQDPASPRYQGWLTPQEFGRQFGPAQQDIDAITSWLQSQGFQVTEVAAGRRAIEFTGTVRQVESTFHTQINRYEWDGQPRIANGVDISIPEALSQVVGGIASLNNFGARPMYHRINAGPVTPLTNFGGGMHGLGPSDFASIYNVSSLWNAGYDGTGQSIAVVGQSNIRLSDVTSFRAMFGLPVNNPTIIVNGRDPGIVASDETEADLDVEWAGAVAKNASIKFVTSASTNTSDGVTLSAQYIVNHAVAPVMSLSYGLCETLMGAANQFYSSLWQQAAAQGISVFVASGDSGAAGCDVPYSSGSGGTNATAPASRGFGINGLASTPYNVAVGGTQFNDTASPATYWNAANDSRLASAKGYIPEMAWNESSYTAGASGNGLYAAGGGTSLVWPRPSWQAGTGVPSGTMRLIPDVSLTAAGHDGYTIQQEGGLYLVGGTSASTPAFAGLMAIINQYTHTTNGNPNAKFYALASQVPSVYHDITTGSNAVPCVGGSANCSAAVPSANAGKMNGYSAGAGYDLATGLGSVDAYALVTNWGGTPAGPAIASLSPNPMTGSTAAQRLSINGAGFVAGSNLKVTVGTKLFQASQITVSNSQLTVSVTAGANAQSLPVQVTNGNGQVSNTVNLTVNAPIVAPVITSVTPNPLTASSSAQTLIIKGSGFLAGLQLLIGSATILPSQLSSLTATQLQVSVVASGGGTYSVRVVNANGGASNSLSLQVNAPLAPAITSMSPNPMTGTAASQTLTIYGTNFPNSSTLRVVVGALAFTGSQITYVNATQIKVSAKVGVGSKTLGVQVSSAMGQSNTATLTVK